MGIILEKIDKYRFRIPRQGKMRTDGIVYTNERMIEAIKQDQSLIQVANVACLPGIVGPSMAMPDIHEGYGFCLTKDTKILTNFGFYKAIGDFRKDWVNQNLKSIDLNYQRMVEASILRFIKLKPKEIFKIITKGGYEIKATADHPLFTPLGMRPVNELSFKEKIAIFPFQGVPYQETSEEIIISEKDIKKTLLELGRKPDTLGFEIILQKLKKRNLLPLTYKHPNLPYILKIMGFVFGDASMNFMGKRGDGILNFSGKSEDLEEVRKDLKKIGYTPSPIHLQKRKDSRGRNKYYYSFDVNASSLVVLLETLGVPRGEKVSQAYRIPKWIFKAPLWQKRLFLASLFGCELRMPHRRLDRRGCFNAPVFPMAKREGLIKNGKDFLKDISKLLKEFGVRVLYINKRRKHISTKGETSWALELIISPKPENLINLWGKIGFEYNFERSFNANVAVQYLKLKQKILDEKERAIKVIIPQLLKNRLSYQKIALRLAGNPLTKRFIMDICYKLNKGKKVIPRIPTGFPLFKDYLKEVPEGFGQSGMVWDEIKEIKRIPYQDFVYDFTVSHPDHNFIADNFVVSNCIGGVAAFDLKEGIISPGGVGFDINCGVRLLKSNLTKDEVEKDIKRLTDTIFVNVPSGVGSRRKDFRLNQATLKHVLNEGVKWALKNGFARNEDLAHIEEGGCLEGANPDFVSNKALERGKDQLGTLGSGNHFVEIGYVEKVYNEKMANTLGLFKGEVTILIHTGSRGLGHQVCDDYIKVLLRSSTRYGIELPDRQLCCAPISSEEGQQYLSAMACAANFAFTNRQLITHWVRETFAKFFKKSPENLGLFLIYDVCHNIAKIETHEYKGKKINVCVHRKGATRAFPLGHPDVPRDYKEIGQPVLIPGDMGRYSYVLVGTKGAMEETFGSTCHGAGRVMSRRAAKKTAKGRDIEREMSKKGIYVRGAGRGTLVEEISEAYKDVADVIEAVDGAKISSKVVRLKPLGVVKG